MTARRRRKIEGYLASRDATLGGLIETHGPCPLLTEPGDPLYTLFTAIIGQQISAKAARGIRARFCAHLGADTGAWVAQLLDLPEERLRGFGLSRNKAASIHGLAAAVAQGALDVKKLARLNDTDAVAELVRFKGIGPWTAEVFLLFGLRRIDTFTYRDAGLRRGIQRAYAYPAPPTDDELRRLSNLWTPYRGVASWYLWRAAD